MKRRFFINKFLMLSITLAFFCVKDILAQDYDGKLQQKPDWWNEDWITPYQLKDTINKLSFIQVEGNKFVDEKGDIVLFKGVSISDPDKISKNGKWGKDLFIELKKWGVNLIRIPVHPISWHQRGKKEYIKLLDEAVDYCSELGIYVIIDWHSIGNLRTEIFQAEMYNTSLKESMNFWKTIAGHYRNVPTVAFYELFNEPTTWHASYGTCSWKAWKEIMEEMIDLVYAVDKNVIPLVAGFNWAYDLKPVRLDPIEREGIAYVTHPYPGKCTPPREPKWEMDFGFVADTYPVIATEIGYMAESEDVNLVESDNYKENIVNYFHKKGISWTAWVFDPDWVPHMIQNWEYKPTEQGEFFRDVMQGKYELK